MIIFCPKFAKIKNRVYAQVEVRVMRYIKIILTTLNFIGDIEMATAKRKPAAKSKMSAKKPVKAVKKVSLSKSKKTPAKRSSSKKR